MTSKDNEEKLHPTWKHLDQRRFFGKDNFDTLPAHTRIKYVSADSGQDNLIPDSGSYLHLIKSILADNQRLKSNPNKHIKQRANLFN